MEIPLYIRCLQVFNSKPSLQIYNETGQKDSSSSFHTKIKNSFKYAILRQLRKRFTNDTLKQINIEKSKQNFEQNLKTNLVIKHNEKYKQNFKKQLIIVNSSEMKMKTKTKNKKTFDSYTLVYFSWISFCFLIFLCFRVFVLFCNFLQYLIK